MAQAPKTLEEFIALPIYVRPEKAHYLAAEVIEHLPDSIAFVVDSNGQGWTLIHDGERLCRRKSSGLFG